MIKKKLGFHQEGFFAFGLGRDRANDIVISINNKKIIKESIKKRLYNIQRIDGLEEKKVNTTRRGL